MSKSYLRDYFRNHDGVSIEDGNDDASDVSNGVEIHYDDSDGKYQVDTITGDSPKQILESFLEAINAKIGDDEISLRYCAAADKASTESHDDDDGDDGGDDGGDNDDAGGDDDAGDSGDDGGDDDGASNNSEDDGDSESEDDKD